MARSRKARTVADWFTHHRVSEAPAGSVRYRHRSSREPRTARPQRDITLTDDTSLHDDQEMDLSSDGDSTQSAVEHEQHLAHSSGLHDNQEMVSSSGGNSSQPYFGLQQPETSRQSPSDKVSLQGTLIDQALSSHMRSTPEDGSHQQGAGHSGLDSSSTARQLSQQQGAGHSRLDPLSVARQLSQLQGADHSELNFSSTARQLTKQCDRGRSAFDPSSPARRIGGQ
jgi:hypothetical protein